MKEGNEETVDKEAEGVKNEHIEKEENKMMQNDKIESDREIEGSGM